MEFDLDALCLATKICWPWSLQGPYIGQATWRPNLLPFNFVNCQYTRSHHLATADYTFTSCISFNTRQIHPQFKTPIECHSNEIICVDSQKQSHKNKHLLIFLNWCFTLVFTNKKTGNCRRSHEQADGHFRNRDELWCVNHSRDTSDGSWWTGEEHRLLAATFVMSLQTFFVRVLRISWWFLLDGVIHQKDALQHHLSVSYVYTHLYIRIFDGSKEINIITTTSTIE